MVGRNYRWRGEVWQVLCRWQGKGPRNVLITRLRPMEPGETSIGPYADVAGRLHVPAGELVVRPFRGLRRA